MNLKDSLLFVFGYCSQKKTKSLVKYITKNYYLGLKLKGTLTKIEYPFHILIYHRVLPSHDPFAIHVTPAHIFEKQIQYLSSYFNIVSLDKMIDDQKNGCVKLNSLCITFDDGYIDNYQYAFPILKKYNVPATIFLATDYINTKKQLWFDQVLNIIENSPKTKIDMSNFGRPDIDLSNYNARKKEVNNILEWLKRFSPLERNTVIQSMKEKSEVVESQRRKMLNWEEIREMNLTGIEFGSHTKSHPILSKLSIKQIQKEITESKKIIEGKLDKEVKTFAYPNGKVNDYNKDCIEILRESGYQCAVTTNPGKNFSFTNNFELHRFQPWDKKPENFIGRVILSQFM